MEIVLTGTGSPLPDANRAGPSTLVKAGDAQILVDAGRGVVMRLAGAGAIPAFLSGVLITHLHSDHVCALNDVITTHWVMTQGNVPLRIWGPPGTSQFVERQIHTLEADIGYRIEHHEQLTAGPNVEVTELEPGTTFSVGEVQIRAEATVHAPVKPTLGYRFEHGGVSAAIVGDTIPCEGVDSLVEGSDAYVQTVIRDDMVRLVPNEMIQDILDYHSTLVDAAQTAAKGGTKRLVLTHMVPAPAPGGEQEWADPARDHYDGEIVIGGDLTTVTIEGA